MELDENKPLPDNTAVRTALWRALHVQVDALPHIIEDEIGLQLIAPDDTWRERPDMSIDFTKRLRASMVARARFIEDLAIEQAQLGIEQYVILGAGLDTFAQRRPKVASNLRIFEIDQIATQAWKQKRLIESGFGIADGLRFVSVDFEVSSWWEQLIHAGFDTQKPAIVACTGVTLYLSKKAIWGTLTQLATLAPGSMLAIAFYLPLDLLDEEDKFLQQVAENGARKAGTPFINYFTPDELLVLARNAGFKTMTIVSSHDLAKRYFANRTDNLSPASGEIFLVAKL